MDAEGGGASLDEEKLLTELTEAPGASKVIEDGVDTNAPVTNSKKVSRDEILIFLFML